MAGVVGQNRGGGRHRRCCDGVLLAFEDLSLCAFVCVMRVQENSLARKCWVCGSEKRACYIRSIMAMGMYAVEEYAVYAFEHIKIPVLICVPTLCIT